MLKKIVLILSGVAMTMLPAWGDQWNKKTVLTFSQPVEVPGLILPAGQYVFKLADSNSNRHIVQIFNAAEDEIFATILAIPHYRMEPADGTVILFEERRSDQPQAIHAWFYPGETYGQEFVYPKSRALELAKETHQPVLMAEVQPSETPAELEQTPVAEATPENEVKELPELAPPPVSEHSVAAEMPHAVTPPEVTVAAPEPELPKTAGNLPLIALFGVWALASALMVRMLRVWNS